MILAGVDYSITCPGIFIYDTSEPLSYTNGTAYAFPQKYKGNTVPNITILTQSDYVDNRNNITRYHSLASKITDIIYWHGVDKVLIEDYALRAIGKLANIAEATGIFKCILEVEYNIPVIPYPPTTIKKTFSGKGNADKEKMAQAFYEKEGFHVHECLGTKLGGNPASDLIDSYAVLYHHLKGESNGEAS